MENASSPAPPSARSAQLPSTNQTSPVVGLVRLCHLVATANNLYIGHVILERVYWAHAADHPFAQPSFVLFFDRRRIDTVVPFLQTTTMQLTTLLINALMASLAAAGNPINDPKACYNAAIDDGKRDVEQTFSPRYAASGTIEKRLRQTRAVCLACCHGAATLCDAACRARFSGPGAVSLGDH